MTECACMDAWTATGKTAPMHAYFYPLLPGNPTRNRRVENRETGSSIEAHRNCNRSWPY